MPTTTCGEAATALIDEVTGTSSQDYRLTRVYRITADWPFSDTVRIRVVRNGYSRQSLAVAETLDGRHWSETLDDPPSNWHAGTSDTATTPEAAIRELGPVAAALARRVATILTA